MTVLKDTFIQTKEVLEKTYGQKVENLRHYFDLSDRLISSLCFEYKKEARDFQRINTYILANNFEFENDEFLQAYQSRLLRPFI